MLTILGDGNTINNYQSKFYKWLILGDSVTMGIGVQDDSTFIGILNTLESKVNFINLSLIGYSSKDYLNIVKSLVIDNERNLKFDKILIFWTLNDTYSNYPSDKTAGFSSKNTFYPIINYLRNNSKAYYFLKNLFNDRSKDYYDFDRQFYSFEDSTLENSVNSLKFIATLCKSKEISCYLFILPYEYQIRNFNKNTIFAPQETLIKLMKDSSINIIDCKNAFINYEKKSRDLYLYGDGIHFSELGHKVLANYIEGKINQQ